MPIGLADLCQVLSQGFAAILNAQGHQSVSPNFFQPWKPAEDEGQSEAVQQARCRAIAAAARSNF